jgi:hypothetical protein
MNQLYSKFICSGSLFKFVYTRGVPRGDAQDARASPLPPPVHPPPGHVHPPPPQPERLVMRKDEGSGQQKKCKFVYLNILINYK